MTAPDRGFSWSDFSLTYGLPNDVLLGQPIGSGQCGRSAILSDHGASPDSFCILTSGCTIFEDYSRATVATEIAISCFVECQASANSGGHVTLRHAYPNARGQAL